MSASSHRRTVDYFPITAHPEGFLFFRTGYMTAVEKRFAVIRFTKNRIKKKENKKEMKSVSVRRPNAPL